MHYVKNMPDAMISLNENNVGCVFETDFTVQSYETDRHGFARPVALLNYLQSAAGVHATQSTPDGGWRRFQRMLTAAVIWLR